MPTLSSPICPWFQRSKQVASVASFALCSCFTHASERSPQSTDVGVQIVTSASSVDAAWNSLASLTSKKLDTQKLTGNSVEDSKLLSQNEQFLQTSFASKAFYGKYPKDSRASVAKKLEVISALEAVQYGSSDYAATASALATSYKADKSNSSHDRFDVALAIIATKVTNGKATTVLSNAVALEATADALYAEFGDIDDSYSYYISLIQTTDSATAARVATKILAYKKIPSWASAMAQTAVKQNALLSKTSSLKLTATDGTVITLASTDKPTVLYFWDGLGDASDLAVLKNFTKSITTTAKWVYIKTGGPAAPTATEQAKAAISGYFYFEPMSFSGPIAKALYVTQLPYAAVFDSNGKLIGMGAPAQISTLLQSIK